MANEISVETTQTCGGETGCFVEEEEIIIKCGLEEMMKQFFEHYVIVWHDPEVNSEENKIYLAQLERFCQVKAFADWREAVLYIQEAKAYYHVVTSGTNGELLVKEISESPKVSAIYVFCRNREYHEAWAKNYEKVSCVETEIKNLHEKMRQSLLKWFKERSSLKMNLPAFAPIFNDRDKSGMNNLHRYLKVIPHFKNRLQAKRDFLNLSRAIYSSPMDHQRMILFEENYQQYDKKNTLNWYTQESFLYQVTNKCLRIATSDSIQYCRLLLRDIEQAIKEQYLEKSKNFNGLLYRGAYISEEEWSNLKQNLNGEIEMHGFLSVSKDKNVALNFLGDRSKMVFITILVPKGPENGTEQGFAEVYEFSEYPQEREILFNVRSRFTVLETDEEYSPEMPCRHLVLLYGAQGFRKFVTEENPMLEIVTPNTENISCAICHANDKLFVPINMDKFHSYFCKKCLTSDFLKANNSPFFCIPMTGQEQQQIKLKVILMKPTAAKVSMYGYECKKCQIKKQPVYFQCTECSSERREVWCENCAEGLSECLQKGHSVISESLPFSFWCEKMSKKELDHLKFQNKILEQDDEVFQQAEMYIKSQEYKKAMKYYKIYIEKNREKKKNDNSLAIAYNNLANEYDRQAEYQKALKNYHQSLEIYKSLYGENHLEVATCLSNMGIVYYHQSDYNKALEHYSRVLEIRRKAFNGDNHPSVADSLRNLGDVYERQAEYKKALEHYSQALEIRKSLDGNNHPNVATSYNNIGSVYYRQAEYNKALEYYSQALEIDKLFYGENHPHVATCYNNVASVFRNQGEYNKALEHHSRALEIRKAFYGNNHPYVAICCNNIGSVYERQAEYKKALEHHSQALEIRKSLYGNNNPFVAMALSKMGDVYERQAEYKKALEHYSQAVEIFKSFYGDNHPHAAANYINPFNGELFSEKQVFFFAKQFIDGTCRSERVKMGQMENRQAEYNEALEYFLIALEILRSLYGENHPHMADALTGLGKTNFFLGEHEKALEYYFKSLEMKKSIFNDHHPDLATLYCNIGQAYNELKEQSKALEYHLMALKIKKQYFQDNHPDIAESCSGIGRVLFSLGEYATALEYHFKSLEIRMLVFHKDHPDVAECYFDIANVWKSQGDFKKALEYCEKSLEIRKLVFGDSHPDVVRVSDQIQEISKVMDKRTMAEGMKK